MPVIELQHAYQWQCPHRSCRRVNFVSAAAHAPDESDPEELVRIREMLHLEPWQEIPEGVLQTCPAEVKCRGCGRRYRTAEAIC